jgi:adenylate cyclase
MERRTMTVGFADLSHFARAVEQLGDEGGLALLEEAQRAAGDAILAHGGEIRKYIGDAVLFTFADPGAATRAAHAIVDGFRHQSGDLDVRWYVAMATGEVLMCQVGHPSRRVDDIMGATVNRAGKLMKDAHRSPARLAFCDETRGCDA